MCLKQQVEGRNANNAWVAQKASTVLRNEPNAKVLQTWMQDTHKVPITYGTTWRGVQLTLKEIYGNLIVPSICCIDGKQKFYIDPPMVSFR